MADSVRAVCSWAGAVWCVVGAVLVVAGLSRVGVLALVVGVSCVAVAWTWRAA